MERTEELVGQTRGVGVDSAAPGAEGVESAKRKRRVGETETETEAVEVPSSPLPIRGKKVRRVEEAQVQERVQTQMEGLQTDREDITAEVEARLRAKEKARARIKEGGNGRKRRRRSSTVEAEERRGGKRVKRESAGGKRRSLGGGGEEGGGQEEEEYCYVRRLGRREFNTET